MTVLNFFMKEDFEERTRHFSLFFQFTFMSFAEIVEAINARGSLRELPEGRLPRTAPAL